MSTLVEYILNLRGNLTPQVNAATTATNQLNSAMGGVKTALGALGLAFGAFQIASFVKEGVEKYHELEQATAKVEANLRSTDEIAGVSLNNVQNYAKELSGKIQAGRADIMDMASQLLTFPAISKDIFQSSMGMVADIAKQTGHGLSETAIMYGKALNDPVDGLQKMMRYGVMFTDAEKQKITKLQESGKLIAAQKLMIDSIAHSGYAGVAEAMFNADPMAKFNKMIGSAKLAIGEYATEILKKILPALEWMAGKIKSVTAWMKDHEKTMALVVDILGVVAASFVTISIATNLWAGAQWLLNAALTANPITIVITSVAALVGGVIWAWNNFEGFRKTILSIWEVMKSFGMTLYDIFGGIAQIYKGLFTFDLGAMKSGLSQVVSAAADAGKNIADAWAGGQEKGAKSFAGSTAKGLIPSKAGMAGKAGEAGETIAAPKTKAEGQKVVNIHIAYNAPLIQGFTISTTNIKEGMGSLKEKVEGIITGASSDVRILAGY